MNPTSNIAMFLKGVSKVLGGVCIFSFVFGGGLLHAVSRMDRSTGELVGIGIAGACVILALLANELADRILYRQENPRE